jgi:MoaA/NifB/PqqE/SkfB family radical SAM enzyme
MGKLIKTERFFLKLLIYFIGKFYLRKPDKIEFLQEKIRSFSLIRILAWNELFFLCNNEKAAYVSGLNIEITNNCNLNCSICPASVFMKRPRGMMSLGLFNKLISECDYVESIQFSQWGEPLLHPDIMTMIKIAKNAKKGVTLVTNGTLLDEKAALSLLETGIDRVIFSVDGTGDIYSSIRGHSFRDIRSKISNFKKLRDQYDYNTRIDISMVICDSTVNGIDAFSLEFMDIADRMQFIPAFTDGRRNKKCREPWRGHLTVCWDGAVTACCVDFNNDLLIGDINNGKITDILNSSKAVRLRHQHITHKFPEICRRCCEYSHKEVSPRFN